MRPGRGAGISHFAWRAASSISAWTSRSSGNSARCARASVTAPAKWPRPSAQIGDRRWRDLLATHDALVGDELERFRGQYIKSTGDGVLATFDGPARAIRCACAIRDALQPLGLMVRAGLHTGEIELRGADISGIAVVIAERVTSLAGSSEVLVSRTVADLLAGSEIDFGDRGEHELKGVPGTWRLFSVRA